MASPDTPVWGIHAGRTGDADSLFLERSLIGVGWAAAGSLTSLPKDRDAFKTLVERAYPDMKPGAVPTSGGQLYRFVHEMRPGELVVYPSKRDRMINIGLVEGNYTFEPTPGAPYPNRRSVLWLNHVPRTSFSQGALYELGSALSLFQIKNYAEEFRSAAEGHMVAPPVAEDETVAVVVEDIVETTSDFVLKRLAQFVKGHPFEQFVAHLLNTMGYRTRVSPQGPDGGVDILAHRDELGFEPPIIKVELKSGTGTVDEKTVRALYGTVGNGEFGLLISLGTFTAPARVFARSKANLRLIDGAELVELILEHYEDFESRYKGLVPLKRVYVPEAVEADA